MARKLAITISGAVSLGSYESGVAFEILDAVAQHNQWADTNGRADDRIEIDVLTGASAGGMTVSMIARRLLFDGAAMAQPYDNPMYNAWVQEIDIRKLLSRQADEPATHSIFSSDCVIDISRKYLTGTLPSPPQPHPALPASDQTLHLGLALSNLNGVDYIRSTQSGGTFTYTRHEDQLIEKLDSTTSAQPQLWETIRMAAVSCGAFPFAFRVQDLYRNLADYTSDSDFVDKTLWNNQPSRFFSYTDGGVFQNQPLGMAKKLVETVPGGRLNSEKRGYLFIAPQPKTSAEMAFTRDPAADATVAFGSANADFKATALRLVGAVFGQSEFQDWAMAESINDKLRLLDDRAHQLQAWFQHGQVTPAMTAPLCAAILPLMFPSTAAIDAARNQLRQQYAPEYASFGASADVAAAWLDTVLVLEVAADLHEKEEMFIYDFVADTKMLAGNELEAFQGFFDVKYRKHDYDYGRTVAQAQLQKYAAQDGSVFLGLQWKPKPIDPIDATLNNLQMSSVDENLREGVCDQICSAASDILQEAGLGAVERDPILWFVIKPKVKKALAL
jgi:hypothetical protein